MFASPAARESVEVMSCCLDRTTLDNRRADNPPGHAAQRTRKVIYPLLTKVLTGNARIWIVFKLFHTSMYPSQIDLPGSIAHNFLHLPSTHGYFGNPRVMIWSLSLSRRLRQVLAGVTASTLLAFLTPLTRNEGRKH